MSNETPKKNSINLSALIAIIVSFLSVLFTGLTYYNQYYKVDNDLKATILNFMIDYPNEKTDFATEIVFTNNGNQQCSISSIEVQRRNITSTELNAAGVLTTLCFNQPPFSIKSGDVITKLFKFGKNGLTVSDFDNGPGKKGETIEFSLAFNIISSDGKYHHVSTPIATKVIGSGTKYRVSLSPFAIALLPSETKEYRLSLPRNYKK